MSGLQLTPEEYVTEIIMSENRFLLLEGSDDQDFFILIGNYLRKNEANLSAQKLNFLKSIVIETAEYIKGELGNRAKIEEICALIAQEPPNVKNRVLGFVDREFREFEYNNSLKDHLETHRVNDRLIWTRGHSIENYFFEIETFKEAFNNYLVSRFYQEAFEIFEAKFDDILRVTSALSLAGLSEDLLQVVSKSLEWQCIDITSNSLKLNLEEWQRILNKRFKLDQLRINNLIDKFTAYLVITEQCDSTISRWLSHGHIGFNFMFAVYGKCLYLTASLNQQTSHYEEANKVTKNKDMRFSTVANAWIRNQSFEIQNNRHDFPIKCFWILINDF